jgi:hypothetical protein
MQERIKQLADMQRQFNELADQLQRTTDAGQSLKLAREISKVSRLLDQLKDSPPENLIAEAPPKPAS